MAFMHLESPVFRNGATIPEDYTAHGRDISPPLHFGGIPAEAKELVLICEDTDSVFMSPYTHWLVYNIHPHRQKLAANAAQNPEDRVEFDQGRNSKDQVGYFGPDPSPGTGLHHYHFRLYALDIRLNLPPGCTRSEVLSAMEGHVLAQAEYIGVHQYH